MHRAGKVADPACEPISVPRAGFAEAQPHEIVAPLGRWMLCASLVMAYTGCTLWGKNDRDTPRAQAARAAQRSKAPAPRRVGIVTLVNEQQRFVLIDAGTGASATGKEWKVYRQATEVGAVNVSAIGRRPFVIADILRGEPRAGDQVYE
ncbi:MAG: hypothetical protein M3463_11505 [Verrucomicrobiota bacterium]|nr:hypothetical protein [Verrucomicrobiota bacterium]